MLIAKVEFVLIFTIRTDTFCQKPLFHFKPSGATLNRILCFSEIFMEDTKCYACFLAFALASGGALHVLYVCRLCGAILGTFWEATWDFS